MLREKQRKVFLCLAKERSHYSVNESEGENSFNKNYSLHAW